MVKQSLYGPIKVGGDILCYCTKCQMDLAHVIVSMVDGKVAKVICKTCKSEHKYRDFLKSTKSDSVTKRNRIKSPKLPFKVPENVKSIPYSQNRVYKEGEIINHGVFGLGLVETVNKKKITVLFNNGRKVLIHGM